MVLKIRIGDDYSRASGIGATDGRLSVSLLVLKLVGALRPDTAKTFGVGRIHVS